MMIRGNTQASEPNQRYLHAQKSADIWNTSLTNARNHGVTRVNTAKFPIAEGG
jgi:hypothetical protein